jgi:hypothetical protein
LSSDLYYSDNPLRDTRNQAFMSASRGDAGFMS